MGLNIILPLRIVQGLFAVVVLILSSFVAHWYSVKTVISSPSQINFLLFGALWSFLSLTYLELIPRFLPRLSNPYVSLGVEFTNVLFWFSGFVSLADFLSKLLFCRGAVCHSAQADVAFAAMLWIVWTASASLRAKDVFKAGLSKPPA
ncbi:marvel domain-containing protein, partial [Podospora australis]